MFAPGGARGARGRRRAAIGIRAGRTDVEVQLGDAADEIIVGARNRARHDLAVIARRRVLLLVVGDELVVGVFELHLRDGGIKTLDQRHARLGERRHRHQCRALRELAAAIVGFHLAGVVGDLPDRDAHRMLADISAEAAQRVGIGRFVCDHRRTADGRGVAARGAESAFGETQPASAIAASAKTSGLQVTTSALGHGRGSLFL